MQLNPARGRKLIQRRSSITAAMSAVYAAQPREGTETVCITLTRNNMLHMVYAAQPREGTETRNFRVQSYLPISVYAAQPREGTETSALESLSGAIILVYAAQPREGTETQSPITSAAYSNKVGLCSSTPRGDGNMARPPEDRTSPESGLCSSTPRGDGNTMV